MMPKHLLIKFDELKVGQRVWSAQFGYVTISCFYHDVDYPIRVNTHSHEAAFSCDGKMHLNDLHPTLFLDCPFIEEERVVEVSQDGETWHERTLINKFGNKFVCWGLKDPQPFLDLSKTPFCYSFMRELQPEPIKEKIKVSKRDIAKLMGCGVEEIEIV